MNIPSDSTSPRRSLVPLLLAFLVLAAAVAVLSMLTLGFAGVIVALVLCLAVLIGLQYLVWGWWLTRYLRGRELRESAVADQDSC